MHDETALVLARRELPQLLQADAEFLRIATRRQIELGEQSLRQRAARAFGKERVLAEQRHTRRVGILVMAVAANTEIAGDDALDLALVAIRDFRGRKARIDLDTERFGLRRQPATDIAETNDVIAVIVHQRRHDEVGNADAARMSEIVEAI